MSGFRRAPSYNVDTPGQLIRSAYDAPMAFSDTVVDQMAGGLLESYGLGTAIRELSLPDLAPSEPGLMLQPAEGGDPLLVPDTPQMRRRALVQGVTDNLRPETAGELQIRRDQAKALSQDEYTASPYYRVNIPYDPGMTEDRAAALASWDDAKKVREFYKEKRPIAAFIGNLVGQAADPINYIPVAGPLVKAAAVGKFGRIAGEALTGAIDAAGNTAAFGLATADARGELGDDISWQTMTTDIAMSALIGSAFGAIGGVIGRRTDARRQGETAERLATLQNTQEARVALNEAIDGLVTTGEVDLTPNATEPLQRVASDIQARAEQIDRVVQAQVPVGPTPRQPQPLFDFIASIGGIQDEAGSMKAMGVDRKFVPGRGALVRKSGKSLDYAREAAAEAGYFNHIYGDAETAAAMSTPDDLLNLMDAEARGTPAYSPQDSDRLSSVADHEATQAAQDAYRRIVEEIDSARDELGIDHQIDDTILTRASEFAAHEGDDPVTALERAMEEDYRQFATALEERGESLSNEPEFDIPFFEDIRTGSEPGGDARAAGEDGRSGNGQGNVADRGQLQNAGSAQGQAPGIDTSRARPDPEPEGRKQAEQSIARSDDYKSLAQQYRVDPETGSFLEEAEIRQLDTEGRLTDDDRADLDNAQKAFDDGAAYGEALKAAVACLI